MLLAVFLLALEAWTIMSPFSFLILIVGAVIELGSRQITTHTKAV